MIFGINKKMALVIVSGFIKKEWYSRYGYLVGNIILEKIEEDNYFYLVYATVITDCTSEIIFIVDKYDGYIINYGANGSIDDIKNHYIFYFDNYNWKKINYENLKCDFDAYEFEFEATIITSFVNIIDQYKRKEDMQLRLWKIIHANGFPVSYKQNPFDEFYKFKDMEWEKYDSICLNVLNDNLTSPFVAIVSNINDHSLTVKCMSGNIIDFYNYEILGRRLISSKREYWKEFNDVFVANNELVFSNSDTGEIFETSVLKINTSRIKINKSNVIQLS
jgi:hypothetical protein